MLQKRKSVLLLLLAGCLAAGPAMAEKPDFAGGGGGPKHMERGNGKGGDYYGGSDRRGGYDRDDRKGGHRNNDRDDRHFSGDQRSLIRDYYAQEFRSGNCPPGLAKKRNGCLPPGQAKKWAIGRPLPHDLIYYDLPASLLLRLGPPSSTYRYVRVGADILKIAIGTGLVIDAIEDLSNM